MLTETVIGKVYYGWSKQAIENLKRLCEETGAKIIVSSDWRKGRSFAELKLIFKIHDLDEYVVGVTYHFRGAMRGLEIEEFLIEHPSTSFVVLDDHKYDLHFRFPTQFIHCQNCFDGGAYEQAITVLNQTHYLDFSEALLRFNGVRQNSLRVRKLELTLEGMSLICRHERYSSIRLMKLLCLALVENHHLNELAIKYFDCNLRDAYPERDYVEPLAFALKANRSIKSLTLHTRLTNVAPLITALEAREVLLDKLALSEHRLGDESQSLLAQWLRVIKHPFVIELMSVTPLSRELWKVLLLENKNLIPSVRQQQIDDFKETIKPTA